MRVEILLSMTRERGERLIRVDGKAWGTIKLHQHGVHGASYTFHQIGVYGEICESAIPPYRGRSVTCWNRQKYAARDSLYRGSKLPDPVPPIGERLQATAERLVDMTLLRDPDLVQAERAKLADAMKEKQQRERDHVRGQRMSRAIAMIEKHIPTATRAQTLALADAIIGHYWG